jgi:glucose 1-dehydrogenase
MADVEQWLAGQVAVVTGASSGIGQACAVALARRGADVLVNYGGDRDGAQTTARQIEAAGRRALVHQADVADEAAVRAMFEAAVAAFGSVDILVANAGIQKDGAFTEISKADWDRVIGVNLTGMFLSMQCAVRQFRAQGMRSSRALGKIIAMSSVHEVIPWAGHVNYAASKGGVMLLMKTAAQELAHERIRVNSIAPGAIATPINASVWQNDDSREALETLIPYGRIGEAAEIGEAAAWLASDLSDYVNGTTLFVDGGMSLYPEFRDNG